jgi:hypothetical protein
VEISDAITADLAALSDALEEPGADLALQVQRLGESCAFAVKSYLGFSITLVVGEVPVSFTVLEDFLDPSEILTSVMLPLTAVGDHASGSEVVLYAGTAGAFVDLAADLTFALQAGPDVIQLDQHLTPPDPELGVAGLRALSQQNQAIGILLDRGYDSGEALTELHRLARLDAISVEVAAQQLIDSTVRPTGGANA